MYILYIVYDVLLKIILYKHLHLLVFMNKTGLKKNQKECLNVALKWPKKVLSFTIFKMYILYL